MSERTESFERGRLAPGSEDLGIQPYYEVYETSAPRTTGPEAELTSGRGVEPGNVYGFFTDTSICIGCKACEVACKQWNSLPADDIEFRATSYDNTRQLSHGTWRHVNFVEQPPLDGGPPRWLLHSDVCKHCERAGCLESCPTGAICRTEFGTVFIQNDVCNGCNYCVPSCPFGVITTDEAGDGMAHKCTLCYDRMKGGFEPACAKACPTDSIQFGPVEELRRRARARLEALHDRSFRDVRLYGDVDGLGATNGIRSLRSFFLLMDHPNVYNLPSAPTLPARNIMPGVVTSLVGGAFLLGAVARALWKR